MSGFALIVAIAAFSLALFVMPDENVIRIVAGDNIDISPDNGYGDVTINSTGVGGNGYTEGVRVLRDEYFEVAHNTWTVLPWQVEGYDTDDMFDLGDNTKLTCRTAGKYLVTGLGVFSPAAGRRMLRFTKNGIGFAEIGCGLDASNYGYLQLITIVDLIVNDNIEAYVYQNSSFPLNYEAIDDLFPIFAAQRIG